MAFLLCYTIYYNYNTIEIKKKVKMFKNILWNYIIYYTKFNFVFYYLYISNNVIFYQVKKTTNFKNKKY